VVLDAWVLLNDGLGLKQSEPDLGRVARWTARGLTAYDAAYVALTDAEALPLVTDDDEIVRVAPEVAFALEGITRTPRLPGR
jgi:hypothetical protein